MAKKAVHVVPAGGKWAVRKEGSSKSSAHQTQQAASKAAKSIAKKEKSELFIHGRDGRIRERNSYGNDPSSRKG